MMLGVSLEFYHAFTFVFYAYYYHSHFHTFTSFIILLLFNSFYCLEKLIIIAFYIIIDFHSFYMNVFMRIIFIDVHLMSV